MLKKFFVLTRGRTGSTAIIDELNKTNAICAAQELFLIWTFDKKSQELKETYDVIWPFTLWKEDRNLWNLKFRFARKDFYLANRYLSEAESIAKETGSRGFGFKVLSNNLNEWPFLINLLHRKRYRAVYLTRNVANQVLSGMIANKSGVWNTKDDDATSLESYDIDLDEFRRKVDWEVKEVKNDISLLSSMGIPFIKVEYEEFCNDRYSFYEKIFSFLQIPMELPSASHYVVILKDLKEVIRNYDEVANLAAKMGVPLNV